MVKLDLIQLYNDMVKDYFTSRMYTEEQAKLIANSSVSVKQRFFDLKKLKTLDEIRVILEK